MTPTPINGGPPSLPPPDLVKVRKILTPEKLWESWGKTEADLSAILNRTDLTPEARAYYEDLLGENLRQQEIALHKELTPHLFESPAKKRVQ